ncbi:MAG: hypothetical protein NTY19_27495 [Planctomycetota bacterium]|nr:hypothetical protein [Planctomycetota bacterium]
MNGDSQSNGLIDTLDQKLIDAFANSPDLKTEILNARCVPLKPIPRALRP